MNGVRSVMSVSVFFPSQVVLAPIVEKTVFAPLYPPLLPCQRLIDCIYVGLLLGSVSCSTDWFVYTTRFLIAYNCTHSIIEGSRS